MGIMEDLEVRPVINAYGSETSLGGSLMPPEVIAAWLEASRSFVSMFDLHRAAGRAAAALVGAEMGLVTSGAAAAMATAAAVCIVKRNHLADPDEIRARLPHSEGLANETLIPASHRTEYDQAFEVGGSRLVAFGRPMGYVDSELEDAIGGQTAAVAFILRSGRTGTRQDIGSLARVCELVHQHNLPVVVDAAAEIPPARQLGEIIATGVDLMCLSGGKDICGPNDTGFLFGREDLLEIAHSYMTCPHHQVVRPMKVGKENIAAAVAALKRYVSLDEKARYARWEAAVQQWRDALGDVPHVKAERVVPQEGDWLSQCWPRLRVTVDQAAPGFTAQHVVDALAQGDPPIYVAGVRMPGYKDLGGSSSFIVNPHLLKDTEVEIVASRLRELLLQRPGA